MAEWLLNERETEVLRAAQRELSVVHHAVRQDDAGDAVGRLADVVNDVLLVLITLEQPATANKENHR